MKLLQLLGIILLVCPLAAQDITFNLDANYINQFGKDSDLVSFTPLFQLSSNTIHNKQKSAEIRRLPKDLNRKNTAYGFMYFTGVNPSTFDKEITLLVLNYQSPHPTVYADTNGNLDFTDDGDPVVLKNNTVLKLQNHKVPHTYFQYQISKSKILQENEPGLRNRYAAKFPNGSIVSAHYWLTNRRLSIRSHQAKLNGKPITIFLIDRSADGLFTFQTHDYGDRALIIEGKIDTYNDLTSLLREGEPIDHNAVFELYGTNYYIKAASISGDHITIAPTSEKTSLVYKGGQDVSTMSMQLLDGRKTTVKELVKNHDYLLIDVGGTWCGGCVKQEPNIKRLYKSGKVQVVGLFDHDTPESVSKYVKKHQLKWPVGLVDTTFKSRFRITSFPTYILVSSDGKIINITTISEQLHNHLKS